MPKVSIITSAYIDTLDKSQWLLEAVQSVQKQDFEDWEMIIVDDGSPISFPTFDDKRVRIFRGKDRQGPSLCRNTAVALATSESLYALDSDDLLPEGALSAMYSEWVKDKTKIIYGDIQRLEFINNEWTRGTKFDMPSYTFARVMDLSGIIPVSALHSIDCHYGAGGWDPRLADGLEDISYWVAAGKSGFCGQKINHTTLIYRRHNTSRAYAMRRVSRTETKMRNLIMEIHEDIYTKGEFPMGCCGGGGPTYVPPKNNAQSSAMRYQTLDKYPEDQKLWVQYKGNRDGGFGVVGPASNIRYDIKGKLFKFQIFDGDKHKFDRLGRGEDFDVGVAPPQELLEVVPEQLKTSEKFNPGKPQLAVIERLDQIAVDRKQGVSS